MTENEIKKYLQMRYDREIVDSLNIYFRNDRKFYFDYLRNCADYAKKRIAKGDFNKILFIQNVKITIDNFLRSPYCKKEYNRYLPVRIGLSELYHLAEDLSKYILANMV